MAPVDLLVSRNNAKFSYWCLYGGVDLAKIYFIDVTNRDGVQTARLGLSKLEKTMMNMYLNEMGIFQSEFGFPTTRHESADRKSVV